MIKLGSRSGSRCPRRVAAAACGVVLGLPVAQARPAATWRWSPSASAGSIVLVAQNWLRRDQRAQRPRGAAAARCSASSLRTGLPRRGGGRSRSCSSCSRATWSRACTAARSMAIRESEMAAQAMGVDLAFYKTLAFALGALYAGLSGALFAGAVALREPGRVPLRCVDPLRDGRDPRRHRHPRGPAIGGLLMAVLPEVLRGTGQFKDVLTGSMLLLLLIFLPHGLAGFADRRGWLPRRHGGARGSRAPPPTALHAIGASAGATRVPLARSGPRDRQVRRADRAEGREPHGEPRRDRRPHRAERRGQDDALQPRSPACTAPTAGAIRFERARHRARRGSRADAPRHRADVPEPGAVPAS